jgi:hypothetical protein
MPSFKIRPETPEAYEQVMKIIEEESMMYSSNPGEIVGISIIEAIGTWDQLERIETLTNQGLIKAKVTIH